MNSLLAIIFLYSFYFAALKCYGRQEDSLTRLWNAKKNVKVDTTFYDEFQAIDESRILPQLGYKENDKIEKLPGQPDVNFTQYGGYVTVDEKHGRAFYYYFTEAEQSKEEKPLLLWFNGGPGCSSVGLGSFQELGPFRVMSDGKTLFQNPYAWNKVANVLFLEFPAGVGFSYTNTSSDIDKSGDKMTAEDNYVFLVNWLERFPEYKDRDFYISGESYAGHFVPQLGHQIIRHNEKANKTIVNLKGIIIGNAILNDVTDQLGMYDYFWTHALLSDENHYNIHKYCDFFLNESATQLPQCNTAIENAGSTIYGVLDLHNIYAPQCHDMDVTDIPKKHSITIDPCAGIYTRAYLNSPEVQKALHANITKLNYEWEPCSGNTEWGDSPKTVFPLLRELIAKGLRVWIYSGDTDGRVPVTSTKYSLNKLNLPLRGKFHPWFLHGEVGGYTQGYHKGVTFATVRGAGHAVPSYQPLRALALIKHFLDGKPLPRN